MHISILFSFLNLWLHFLGLQSYQILSYYNGSVYAASTLKTNQSSPSMSTKLRNVLTVFLPSFDYNKHKMVSL